MLTDVKKMASVLDMLIITGDLVDRNDTDGYDSLKLLLDDVGLPYLVVIGNHDDRDKLRASFADHDYMPASGRLDWQMDFKGVRFIGLDSQLPHNSAGELSATSLNFLHKSLQTDKPCIVAVHQPPFAVGVSQQDAVKLQNGRALLMVLESQRPVALLCGHAHVHFTTQFGKTPAIIAPSPINTLNLAATKHVQKLPIGGGYLIHTISNFDLTTEKKL